MEAMIRGKMMYTRVLMTCVVTDDTLSHDVAAALESTVQTFNSITCHDDKNKSVMKRFLGAKDDNFVVSGLLYCMSDKVMLFLEGSTESLFEVLTTIDSNDLVAQATKSLNVQYFTECKGLRACRDFAVFRGSGKVGVQLAEDCTIAQRIFGV